MADKNIDFRRVLNLKTYFDYNAISLTTDVLRIEEVARWKYFFKRHIGIIFGKRNHK